MPDRVFRGEKRDLHDDAGQDVCWLLSSGPESITPVSL